MEYLIKAISVIFILFIVMSACKKDRKDTLPQETQEGYGTFGCLVNNRIWTPKGYSSSPRTIAIVRDSSIVIAANRGESSESLKIILQSTKILQDTLYLINSDSNSFAIYSITCDLLHDCFFWTNAQYQGQLILTRFDTIERIVSGRFSFKADFVVDPLSDCFCDTSVLDITEGRFDLLY
jgi:hypothetical protein